MNPGRNDASLACRSVRFNYPDGTIGLADVDLEVSAGELMALLASNGSGKTTLIKVLGGLLKPQSGSVTIGGMDINRLSNGLLYRRLGLLMQNPKDQLFGVTVDEDVSCGPRNLGLGDVEVERRVVEALASVEGSHLLGRPIHHLSFGEQKRIALAGVLAMKPSIMLLDEPTAGLDPAGEMHMVSLLQQLNREMGITMVFATHAVDLLPLFADRICVLERGRVVECGLTREVLNGKDMLGRAGLRLPYIASLFHEMKQYDGIYFDRMPLTVGEARREILSLLVGNGCIHYGGGMDHE